METITPEQFQVQVRIANQHPVPAGRSWNRRIIPDLQFIAVLSGRFRYRDQLGECILDQGQVLLIEPGVLHDFGALRAGRMAGIHAELWAGGTWAAGDYRSDPLPERVTTPDDWPVISGDFLRCAARYDGYGRRRQALCNALATSIVLHLAEHWRSPEVVPLSARMQAMVEHIRARAARGCTRYELARAFRLTHSHVNDCFRRELGMTPTQVLIRERCRLAYRLLVEDGASVQAAATAAGFSDPFYFSRVFHRHYGRPPSKVAKARVR